MAGRGPLLLAAFGCLSSAIAEFALGGLGINGYNGKNLPPIAAAFLDYAKNFNVSIATQLGPPIVAIPGGVHPNGSFSLRVLETEGARDVGMAAALDLMSGEAPVIGLIGPTYSSVSMPVAVVASVREVPQISCCATNPALSNKDSYPFFLRTVPPDALQAAALWHWVRLFEVPRAACWFTLEGYGQGLFDKLKELARADEQQDRVQGQGVRDMSQEFETEEARASLRLVKQIGSRFIVLLLSFAMFPHLLNTMDEEEMLQGGWQVVASDTASDHVQSSGRLGLQWFVPSGRGQKFGEFQQLWSRLGPEDVYGMERLQIDVFAGDQHFQADFADGFNAFSAFNFDAVYAFFVAVNQLLHEGHAPDAVRGATLLAKLRQVRFEGVSGEVSFDENGDRYGVYELYNARPGAAVVASFSSSTSNFTFRLQPLWADGSSGSRPPPEFYSCDAGFYQDEISKQCKQCGRGSMCLGGVAAKQVACPRGNFSNQLGAVNCLPCARGSFAPDVGSEECLPCPAGTEGPDEGMETCTRCSPGTYMPSGGSVHCLACGGNRITAESGATSEADCLCAEHSFMCDAGCVACPAGLRCPQGLGPPEQHGGFWAQPGARACSPSVWRCRNAEECPAGPLGSCSSGREGPACSNCIGGHHSAGSTCEACKQGDVLLAILLIIVLLLLLYAVSISRLDIGQVSLNTVTAASVTSQLIMAIQALGSIRELSIEWQEPVKSLLELTKAVMLDMDVIRAGCLFGTDTPLFYFVSRLAMCPAACLLLICGWLLQRVRGQPRPFNAVLNQCGILIFAFFLSITRSTVIPFQCVRSPNGSSSMLHHPGIVCFESTEHAVFAGLAVLGILTQPVAVLALATRAVVMYPARIKSGKGLRYASQYRFLFHRFKPENYYYGLILLYRNALVALLPIVLVSLPALQVPLIGVVLLTVQNLQVRLAPWRTEAANQVDTLLSDLLIVLLLAVGPLLVTDEVQSTSVLGWILCVPVLGVLLAAMPILLKAAVKHLRPRAKLYGMFLCHHKAGGGSLCRLIKLLVAKQSSLRVFLDSDQLENLDLLFDIIRTSTKTVVVVLTPELLSRSWCAGEVVTAWKNGIFTVPLLCEGFQALEDDKLQLIPEAWSPQQLHSLSSYGVELPEVHEAFAWLLHELTPRHMPRSGPVALREQAVTELLAACGVTQRSSRRLSASWRPRILVTSSMADFEVLSACEVVQIMLQACLSVECEVVQDLGQLKTWRPFAYYLVVLLYRGIFQDPSFIRRLKLSGAAPRPLQLVPVVADSKFDYGSIEKAAKSLSAQPGGQAQADVLRNLHLSKLLALPFTPLASQGLQEKQVAEIAARIHRYQDSPSAISHDETDDQRVQAMPFAYDSEEVAEANEDEMSPIPSESTVEHAF